MAMGLTCHGALQAEKKVLYLSVNVFRMCQCILCLLLETGPPFYSVIQASQRSSHSCSAISKTDFFAPSPKQ